MAKYVKFLRGTPAAYENLAQKDSDTLYFIYEEDESTGVLYLGTKLIAGGGEGECTGVDLLSKLKDVFLSENIDPDSFLIYDKDANGWVNKKADDLLFIGATDKSSGFAGLVPAPAITDSNLFLKGNGTWAKPEVDHIILTLENIDNVDHSDFIIEKTDGLNNVSGDIVIIKDPISEDKWQYTAYVFDNDLWHAMDGNYNAENVYFDENLITTTAIGNIVLSGGQATIPSAGKNLKEVFQAIFVKEQNPTTTNPSVSLTCSNNKVYEVGTVVTPSYSATFNSGKYSYDDSTGVTVTSWEIKDSNGNIKDSAKGSFDDIIVTDELDYSITAKANYSDGNIPKTNLGNNYADGQIKANSVSVTQGGLKGFRKTFYGTFTNKDEMTSNTIRTLNATLEGLVNGSSITVNIPLDAQRVVFAYPAELNDLSSVIDTNAMKSNIIPSFKMVNVDIEGYNKYEAKSYKVWYLDYANPNNTINSYTFTIAEEEG